MTVRTRYCRRPVNTAGTLIWERAIKVKAMAESRQEKVFHTIDFPYATNSAGVTLTKAGEVCGDICLVETEAITSLRTSLRR